MSQFAKLCFILLCSLSLNRAVFGSDQFLDTCLKIAEARDKNLGALREQLNLAKLRVTRSVRNFFPALTAQRKFSRGKSVTGEDYEAEEFGLKAMQPVYEGGRQNAAYKYDVLTEEAAKYGYTKKKEELFYKIKQAYYELLSLKMEFSALKKAFLEINKLYDKVKIEYNAKAIAELDLLEAENFKEKVENLLKSSGKNLSLANTRLATLVNVDSTDNVPVLMPENLVEDAPEISFTEKECLDFVSTNNLDQRLAQIQIKMANEKIRMNRSKVIPKIYFEGFYGQSGEAFVTEPLQLATVWNMVGRLNWGLWGNSMEANYQSEKANPNEILDPGARIDTTSYEVKFSLVDDLNYFVDAKDSKVNFQQSEADLSETIKKDKLDLQKAFGEYENSLRNARTLKKEIILRKRKLELLRKKNELYEVATVQVMEESSRYAEAISSHAKALYSNYASVNEMERLTLMPLR